MRNKAFLLCFVLLFSGNIAFANEDTTELPNKPVMQCVVDGEVVVFLPTKFMYIMEGLNGNPSGLMAEDTKGKVHTFFQVKNSPYKCSIVDESEV